jgi:hypothetical protein
VELRLGLHGIAVQDRPSGHIVRLRQPQRGLIPTLLDGQAVAPEPMVAGTRLFECPQVAAAPRSFSAATPEDTETTATLAIGNETDEVGQDLSWAITEAESDCSSPSDLTWLTTGATSGTTAPGESTNVELTFSAGGLAAPDVHAGVLCLASNDAGEASIAIPLALQVEYPFSGFFGPIRQTAPELNAAGAGSTIPVQFELVGDRGLAFFASGSPSSHQIDCESKEGLGSASPISKPGASELAYDAAAGRYQINWKTAKSWSGTCRELTVALDDASEHVAYFRFE